MTEHRNDLPLEPESDPILDRYLASLGHYAPSPGFADRVMARVRLPAAARAAAGTAPTVARAPRRRWPAVLSALWGTAAASSAALTAWVVAHWQAVTAASITTASGFGMPLWRGMLDWLATHSIALAATVLTHVLAGGLPPLVLWLLGSSLAVPVSLLALWHISRAPARRPTYVAR